MPFPKKFKKLLETSLNDIDKPDYSWLTYAVCGCQEDACGWSGWVIEAVFKKTNNKHTTGTGDKSLSSLCNSVCPNCGKTLFLTEASIRFVPSKNQRPIHGIPGVDYEISPIEYE